MTLSLTLSDRQGGRWRLADDEPGADQIPADLRITDAIPGGAKELTCSVLRDPRVRRSDFAPLHDVTLLGPGAEPVWEGYIATGPENGERLDATAIGDAGRLLDNTALRMVVADRELGSWVEPTAARRVAIYLGGATVIGGTGVSSDEGTPTLRLELNGRSSGDITAEAWCDAGPGLKNSRVRFDWTDRGIGSAGVAGVGDYDASDASSGSFGADFLTGPTSGTVDASLSRRWALIAVRLASKSTDTDAYLELSNLVIYGQTGIPLTACADGIDGVAGDDALRGILSLADCGITEGQIDPDDFVIPDLKWRDLSTADQMILDTNRFFQRPWLVRRKRLDWTDASKLGRLWRVRRSEGARRSLAGFDAEHVHSGYVVRYTDASSRQSAVVGPPDTGLVGPLGLDTSELAETDEDNPAIAMGRNRPLVVDAPMTTEDGAIRLGVKVKELLKARREAGSLEISGLMARNEAGIREGAINVRSGDRIIVEDEPGAREHFIVERSYDRSTDTASLQLDAPVDTLQAILERLAVVLVGRV